MSIVGSAAIAGIFKSVFSVIGTIASETTIRTVAVLNFSGKVAQAGASVMKTAMDHNIFWYGWALFALPAGFWFALGMFYSTFPSVGGGEWYVAALKDAPELKATYDIIVANIFWTGATGFGIQTVGRLGDGLLTKIFGRK